MRHKTDHTIAIACIAALALLVLTTGSQWHLKSLHRLALEESLQTVLLTTQQAVRSWVNEEKRAAQLWARDPELLRLTEVLLDSGAGTRAPIDLPAALFRADPQRDFSIIDPRHRVIAASNPALIGTASLLPGDREEARRAWHGETTMTPPILSGTAARRQASPQPLPLMFVNTPIRNGRNDIIALLSLHVDPRQYFDPLLSRGRVSGGETLAFNRSGLLLSESRFESQLRDIGLLQPQQRSALNVALRNPGVDLTAAPQPQPDFTHLPLTQMAASAIQGGSDVNTRGYRDYRGVNVIGAWLWDDELNFGLATEIDYDNAYLIYTRNRNLTLLTALFFGVILATLLWLQVRNQYKYRDLSHQLESILSNTTSLIYIKDREDRLLLANRAFNEAFARRNETLLGQNLQQLLMPASVPQSDYYDQLVLEEKRPVEYEQTLALQGEKRVYLTVKFPMCDQEERTYAIGAVSTDITSRREIETALEERERFLDSMMANLPGMVYRRRGDDSYAMVYLSQGCLTLTAYPPKCFINEEVSFLSIIHAQDRELVMQTIKASLDQHRSFEVEYRIRSANGAEKWVWERGRGIYDYNDDIAFIEGFVTDISDRKQIDKELAAHRQHLASLVRERTQQLDYERIRLNALIDNAADGIVNVDGNGIITLFSPAAEKIFGYSIDEVIGKNVTLLIPDDQQGGHLAGIARNSTPGSPPLASRTLQLKAVHKDGHHFPIELSLSQATVDQEVIFTGIIRDITERLEHQKTLEATTAMAEEASQTKSEFLANMSHEIRTPMNAIIGMTQLALQTDLNDKQKRFLTAVNTASNNLMGIINDILDFSKIEAGKLDIEDIPFNLNDVMDTVADMAAARAQEKGLEFIFDIARDVPLHLTGDALRLNQIFTNLCSNAVKFTDSGEIILQARRLRGDDQKVILKFSVTDTGIGISQANQKHLFQAFSQADATITRKYGGTGLGLSICKKLVTLMDGSISVNSEEGKGSRFSFVLSFGLDRSQPAVATTEVDADLAPAAILVAESQPASRRILLAQLQRAGLTATAVDKPAELFDRLASTASRIDLLLLNWKLDNTGGGDLLRQIRAAKDLQQPAVITMVTHHNRDEFTELAQAFGIGSMLTKPFNSSEFFTALNRAAAGERAGARTPVPATPAANAGALTKKRILVVEDNDINQLVAGEILEDLGYDVDLAGNGEEALEKIKHHQFDAVLMDVQMPVMDGYAAAREIRKTAGGKHLPIIAMTANAMASDRDKCLVAGMNDFLGKPINLERLGTTLRHWLQLEEPDSDSSQPPPAADLPLPKQAPGLNIELGLINCSYNKAFYLKLLNKFTGDYSPRLHNVRELIDTGKRQDAIHIVHAIKGVSGNLGATALYASARSLESALRSNSSEAALLSEQFEQVDNAMRNLIATVAGL
ncbi:PAS domain S-box protein [Exilibacterium tricleocarpae]|nr:PAS domain S-box protein [Exilibacterium tricleocarpae]